MLGLNEVSSKRPSISTCFVILSRLATSSSTSRSSLSVAKTTNWLVRVSGTTLLRLSVSVVWMAETIFDGLAYLSWMILVTSTV